MNTPAETGDPRRYDSSSSLVKHAGMAPAENASGDFAGQPRISRRGRPGLRLAVWRAVFPMLRFNPVLAARYAAMTRTAGEDAHPPRPAGARGRPAGRRGRPPAPRPGPGRVAAALLRWIYSLTVHGTSWDPADAGLGRTGAA